MSSRVRSSSLHARKATLHVRCRLIVSNSRRAKTRKKEIKKLQPIVSRRARSRFSKVSIYDFMNSKSTGALTFENLSSAGVHAAASQMSA